jgi:hypothetical protein
MSLFRRRRRPVPEAPDGQLVTNIGAAAFTLAPGHPMRSAPCVICRVPVLGHEVTIAGVTALAGQACSCGALPAEQFLMHAGHRPLRPGQLTDAAHHAWAGQHDHDRELLP